ncbi:MAG: coenzyme A pyrophosphatase [Candidatus Tectimicrobiota bacterium]|nr:MAG: coenzyme A pyrophosphatase [Candidatus Tectomicrobia bacterium]
MLREALQRHRPRRLQVPGRRLAAVLVPLYRQGDGYGVVFVKRSQTVLHHRGQIAFPGGGHEAGDASLLHTALRESAEEIGLQPADVQVLGALDDLLTNSSNYLVRPFVGLIPYPYPFTLDRRETATLLEVPLAWLQRHNPPREEERLYEGRLVRSYFFDYHGHLIWGATAKIVKQLLEVLGGRVS